MAHGHNHPFVSAYLHCPVRLPALAAELAISALDQSMDSFDPAPSATLINPLTGGGDLDALLDKIDEAGRALLAGRGVAPEPAQ